MIFCLVLCTCGVLASSDLAQAADWVSFHNDRYGISVEIPVSFTPAPPPENGDGRTFTSRQSAITVYGHLFVDVGGLADDERDQERMSASEGLKITYRQVSGLATTFSGLKGDIIVYQRAVGTCKGTAAAVIHIEYPAAEKIKFDPVVAHIGRTLQGSNRCWSPG